MNKVCGITACLFALFAQIDSLVHSGNPPHSAWLLLGAGVVYALAGIAVRS